jgi:hypothetical protein
MNRHKNKCTGIEIIQETQTETIERLQNELSETKTENRKIRYKLEEEKNRRAIAKTEAKTEDAHAEGDSMMCVLGQRARVHPKHVVHTKRTKNTIGVSSESKSSQSTILDYLQINCPDSCDILEFIDKIVIPDNVVELFKDHSYTNMILDILEQSWKTLKDSRKKPMYRFPQSFLELPPTPQEVLYIHHEGRWVKESFPNIFITTTIGHKMLKRLDDRLVLAGITDIQTSPWYKTTILGIFIENTLTSHTNILIQDVMLSGIYG